MFLKTLIGGSFWAATVILMTPVFASASEDPSLTIRAPGTTKVYKRSELLRRKDLVLVEIPADPSYQNRKRVYWGISTSSLFKDVDVPKDATLRFECSDGFAAPIDRNQLLNQSEDQAISYIAIEKPDDPWPPVPGKSNVSPGPFYLVWIHPNLSQIGQEQWPFQLVGFTVSKSIKEMYPGLYPTSLPKSHPAHRGLQVFLKNCFACHTLNHQGEAKMGPDLNLPMNPTEYFVPKALRTFIRNPKDLRTWEGAKMGPFSREAISDSELSDLIAYLKQMARHKTP